MTALRTRSETGDISSTGTILFVCTGNICRSPFLELSLRHRLAQRSITSVAVRSAGTEALLRRPIASLMEELLAQEDIDATSFRTRQLEKHMVRSADLILTAERSHRSAVARLLPSALPRIFTVRQAARLINAAPAGSVQGTGLNPVQYLALLCASGRTINQPSGGAKDDIPDPWQQSRSTYRNVAETMKEPLDVLANAIAAHRTAPSLSRTN
ncbi:hypothetical protein ACLRGF_08770 [Mycetocola zhadangensis]|uniref:arsenate reductase/protein-tyrosine-phosphatase family protein n=1 Tax=Mycetocola zhadangensis TaxID=1164595 RepID=UPI003A4E3B3A